MFSKRTALSVLFVLLISLNFIMCSNEIKAHEIFYDGYGPAFNPIPVSWHHKSSGKAHLRISNSGLSKTYADQYSTVRTAWISSTSKISITTVPNTQSTVDMVTTTKDYWDRQFNGIDALLVLGYANLVTTDDVLLKTPVDAKSSSKSIAYASVFLTPYDNNMSTNVRRALMVHELGHVLGLGHPDSIYYPTNVSSIMRSQVTGHYYIPQSHDINDINTKY